MKPLLCSTSLTDQSKVFMIYSFCPICSLTSPISLPDSYGSTFLGPGRKARQASCRQYHFDCRYVSFFLPSNYERHPPVHHVALTGVFRCEACIGDFPSYDRLETALDLQVWCDKNFFSRPTEEKSFKFNEIVAGAGECGYSRGQYQGQHVDSA